MQCSHDLLVRQKGTGSRQNGLQQLRTHSRKECCRSALSIDGAKTGKDRDVVVVIGVALLCESQGGL